MVSPGQSPVLIYTTTESPDSRWNYGQWSVQDHLTGVDSHSLSLLHCMQMLDEAKVLSRFVDTLKRSQKAAR